MTVELSSQVVAADVAAAAILEGKDADHSSDAGAAPAGWAGTADAAADQRCAPGSGGLASPLEVPGSTGLSMEAARARGDLRDQARQEINTATAWASKLDPEARPTGATQPDDREVWLVQDSFTARECEDLIAAAEELGYGATNYPKDYRGNLRLITTDRSLADAMWARLQPFVPPMLRLDGKKWEAVGLNDCWRLSKYHPDDKFGRHCDACFGRNAGEMSMLTVNIYMNGDFEGGSTRFYANGRATEPNLTVQPKPGLCLLFRQPPGAQYYHDGEKVISGQKYLFRSDVMYRRR